MLIAKSLSCVRTSAGVTSYKVAPMIWGPGRLRWSPACPWPAEREDLPYPARVRFLNGEGVARWVDVVIDPTHQEAQAEITLLRKSTYARTIRRQEWAAKAKGRRQRTLAELQERVALLEQEMRALKGQKDSER